jgi:hypothetical protein
MSDVVDVFFGKYSAGASAIPWMRFGVTQPIDQRLIKQFIQS